MSKFPVWRKFSDSVTCARQGSNITFAYNADKQRNKMVYSEGGVPTETTYYVGNYEKIVAGNGTFKEYDYIYTPDGLSAIAIETNGNNAPEYYYINTDYLGSIRAITDVEGNVYARYSYDAWGVQSEAPFSLGRITRRGYTGHEHLTEFGLINMNARMYDPVLGRFLEADPYVADGTYSQDFNRYSYARNNPFVYTDPHGEFPWIPIIIGAIIGAYSGGVMANDGTYNPVKWDYSSGKTWGYLVGGAVIGGASGYVGATIAAGGGFMANTIGVVYSSAFNSIGMGTLSGGKMDPSISFGAASLDLGSMKLRSFNKNNKWHENLGYGLGALANLADVNTLINSTDAHLYTQTKYDDGSFDIISHSGIESEAGEVLMSYGPASEAKLPGYAGFAVEPKLSTPDYYIPKELSLKSDVFTVNKYLFTGLKTISKFSLYQGATSNCVNWSSLGLWLNGMPNIGIHPFLLHGSMALYNTGIYNVLASQLTSYPHY